MTIQSFDFSTGKVVDNKFRQAVLFIDDMNDVEVLQPIFREKRYQLLGLAQNARAAMELMRKHKTGILFLDEDLAEINAKEFVEKARAEYPDFRIVMMSANVTKESIQTAMALGASGYLLKPLKAAAVLKVLDTIK